MPTQPEGLRLMKAYMAANRIFLALGGGGLLLRNCLLASKSVLRKIACLLVNPPNLIYSLA